MIIHTEQSEEITYKCNKVLREEYCIGEDGEREYYGDRELYIGYVKKKDESGSVIKMRFERDVKPDPLDIIKEFIVDIETEEYLEDLS